MRNFDTLGNFSKPVARIILPKLPTFLGNFGKGTNLLFSSETFLGNFYSYWATLCLSRCLRERERKRRIHFVSHWACPQRQFILFEANPCGAPFYSFFIFLKQLITKCSKRVLKLMPVELKKNFYVRSAAVQTTLPHVQNTS